MVKGVAWICVGGIVVGVIGIYAIFVMPLLWIGWNALRATVSQTPEEKAERTLDAMVQIAMARGSQQYLGDLTFLDLANYLRAIRPTIRTDLPMAAVIMHDLEYGSVQAKIVAIAAIEKWMDDLRMGGSPPAGSTGSD